MHCVLQPIYTRLHVSQEYRKYVFLCDLLVVGWQLVQKKIEISL
jgi:hypothetical protein